jgi:hypothetical protein
LAPKRSEQKKSLSQTVPGRNPQFAKNFLDPVSRPAAIHVNYTEDSNMQNATSPTSQRKALNHTYPATNGSGQPQSFFTSTARPPASQPANHESMATHRLLNVRVTDRALSDVHGENHSSFLAAATAGDLDKLALGMNAGMDAMRPGPDGNTVLHLAATNRPEVIAYLKGTLGGDKFNTLVRARNHQNLTPRDIARTASFNGAPLSPGTPRTSALLA